MYLVGGYLIFISNYYYWWICSMNYWELNVFTKALRKFRFRGNSCIAEKCKNQPNRSMFLISSYYDEILSAIVSDFCRELLKNAVFLLYEFLKLKPSMRMERKSSQIHFISNSLSCTKMSQKLLLVVVNKYMDSHTIVSCRIYFRESQVRRVLH